MYEVSVERFEEMVNDALDTIPEEFAQHMSNLAVLVRDYWEDHPNTLGLYQGIPPIDRVFNPGGLLPDTIFVFKAPHERHCDSEEELAKEVHATVMHEVGHYFGLSEEELHALGWG